VKKKQSFEGPGAAGEILPPATRALADQSIWGADYTGSCKLRHEDIGVDTGSDTGGRIPNVLYGAISEAKSPAGYLALVQDASFAFGDLYPNVR